MIRAMLAGCLFALAATAQGGELRGRVVAFMDGDTLAVLDAGRQEHRIRLAEIDAPEKGQPFGQRSKQSLSGLCFGREAVIEDRGHDRYAADLTLYAIQDEARAARRGLWSDAAPVPPWEWRAQHRREAPPKSQ